MISQTVKDAFVVFLENHELSEIFETNLRNDRSVTLKDYLNDDLLDPFNIMSSAFDFYSTKSLKKGDFWVETNMKWRSFVALVFKDGLPFKDKEVL